MTIDKTEIASLTEEHGGAWGINHTRRLLHLVDQIAEGIAYNSDAVWIAAHVHDWGGYPPWAQKGVDHAERSVVVAEEYLRTNGCPDQLRELIVECIALHHKTGSERSVEATLLRDADALDFLGVIGVVRDFSKNPRDLRAAYDQIRKRRVAVPQMLHLERSRQIGEQRVRQMDALLEELETESFGCL